MGNQQAAAKRREEAAADEDRISQLPEHILHHHILSLLPQNDAVRTCILSKSWRHLGPTRPKIEFDESEIKEKFNSVVENTLQRYVDQKLSIHEFILGVIVSNKNSITLLDKWIPMVIMNMGVKAFNLTAESFSLPSIVFQSEFLEELYLKDCKLDLIDNNNNNNCIIVKLPVLKRLELRQVEINEKTFEKIVSSCPLLEHLLLKSCKGLSTIKVNKLAPNLKHYDCYCESVDFLIRIDDIAPSSLETIRIDGGNLVQPFYHQLHNNYNYFSPRLKSLHLLNVQMPTTEFLNNLLSSNNNDFPCLQELALCYCSGFSEFKLSNRSIKRLILIITELHPIQVIAIDAANMIYFYYSSYSFLLPSISFTTASRECNSIVDMCCSLDLHAADTWSLKLNEFLRGLSQTRIFLSICDDLIPMTTNEDTTYYDHGGSNYEPVVVEFLRLKEQSISASSLPNLLNCLFRTCRPRFFELLLQSTNPRESYGSSLLVESALVKKRKTRQSRFWKQQLEESRVRVWDSKTKKWCRSVQECGLPSNDSIVFRLKWRNFTESAFCFWKTERAQ